MRFIGDLDERQERKLENTEVKELDELQRRIHRAGRDQREGDALAERRLDQAAERLKRLEGLQPARWSEMNTYEKKWTLDAAGRELSKAYHSPPPPLLFKDVGDSASIGSYGDGYRYNREMGQIEGSDYGIRLNEKGKIHGEKLLGDDPAVALREYAHEFRHGYQCEQATRYEKPHLSNIVDDMEKAREWSSNRDHYISPKEDFEAYQNQPLEKDANAFADRLIKRVYG